MSEIKVTFDVTSESEEVLTDYCATFLKERGWHCAAPNEEWEPLGDFMARIEISNYSSIYRSMEKWRGRGHALPIRRARGGDGRIVEVCSNPDFDAFCRRNKKP